MPKPKPTTRPKSVPTATPAPAASPTLPAIMPPVWRMAQHALRVLWENRVVFGGITVIYGLLSLLLVGGYSTALDSATIKKAIDASPGRLSGSLGVFAVLLSSTGTTAGQVAGGYQLILVIIVSLALVWALRHVMAGTTSIRIRDAFYHGMYPLVPVILVLSWFMIQLVPLIIGTVVLGSVASGAIIGGVERVILGLVGSSLVGLSLYLVTSTIFALYVVALPDMTPVRALRSARNLVRGRRWTVARKLLFLPIALFLLNLIIVVPVLMTATALAPAVLYILFLVSLPLLQAYLYTVYRELLQ